MDKVTDTRLSFKIIDKKTGQEISDRVIYNIAKKGNLELCDIDQFMVGEDGCIILIDDCGNYTYLDTDRFSVKLDNPQINFNDDRFGTVLNCAVRYAMGRQTYMPDIIISFITPLLPYINDKTLDVFKQDYESNQQIYIHGSKYIFGNPNIDKPLWDKFYGNVCAELERRGDNDNDGGNER